MQKINDINPRDDTPRMEFAMKMMGASFYLKKAT